MLFRDMALSRNDAMKRCMDLSKNFIEHFDKIYNSPISDAKSHWTKEMQAWLDSVLSIKLKSTNKPLCLQQLMDWFFTQGSDSETLFENNKEGGCYDDFVTQCAKTNNVRQSLIYCNLL